jgi:hypothetical protein
VNRSVLHTLTLPFRWLWASPWTAVGLLIGLVGLATGGRAQRRYGAIEFYGGAVARLLRLAPVDPTAMTLGHVILGRRAAAVVAARGHELIHVRQYERWGPLFVPAYLLCSAVLWLRGKDAYRDNPFEREAFQKG